MTDAEDLIERVCYISDDVRDLLLVYMAKRWPEQVEVALAAVEEVESA